MKTTLDLSDDLLHEAKEMARKNRMTLRSLVELALRRLLPDMKKRERSKPIRLVTFRGKGLTSEASRMTPHERILALYEDDRS